MYYRKYNSFRFKLTMITSLLLIFSTAMMAGTSTYDIYFTPPFSGGPAPTDAHFTYDGTQFTNFTILWNGGSWDLTASANLAERWHPPYGGCNPGVTDGAQLAFDMLTKNSAGCSAPPSYVFYAGNLTPSVIDIGVIEYEGDTFIGTIGLGACCFSLPPASFSSGYTVSPEPGSLMLLGSGVVGLAGLIRRRLTP